MYLNIALLGKSMNVFLLPQQLPLLGSVGHCSVEIVFKTVIGRSNKNIGRVL